MITKMGLGKIGFIRDILENGNVKKVAGNVLNTVTDLGQGNIKKAAGDVLNTVTDLGQGNIKKAAGDVFDTVTDVVPQASIAKNLIGDITGKDLTGENIVDDGMDLLSKLTRRRNGLLNGGV
ncbi:MAG: hypothetical protein LBI26_02105 [Holosporales bacterium]|jgi:glutamate mutase epsilon subunit|nr:hypothetical protein [Holosporales bacterium]